MSEQRPMYVQSVWFTPEGDEVPVPIISIETPGMKNYLRVFLDADMIKLDADMIKLEWGWTLHHTAIRIWEDRLL